MSPQAAQSSAQPLEFQWEGLNLSGTMYLPETAGPHPVVLMMQGSGPSDRDSNGYFPPVRDAFLARGIATYSFDKPGCGQSTGDWRDHALDERADQALIALGVLRDLATVDAARVGVWGQSQGGWLAQLVPAAGADLAFAIANSGPSLTVPQQDLYGCEHTMRGDGHSEDEIEAALAFMTEAHSAAVDGVDYEGIQPLVDAARNEAWYGYATVEDAKDWSLTVKLVTQGYDPLAAMRRIRCPFLAIYGGLDVLVPAWRSARESGEALHAAGNRDATVVVFPNANHRIREPETGEFAAGYLDLVGDWAASRVT